jgi:hypothetical protein
MTLFSSCLECFRPSRQMTKMKTEEFSVVTLHLLVGGLTLVGTGGLIQHPFKNA